MDTIRMRETKKGPHRARTGTKIGGMKKAKKTRPSKEGIQTGEAGGLWLLKTT